MPAPRPPRLRSLDVLRGVTMAAMVIVNNPGDWNTVYAPLLHAEWHGWTPTDLIFPAFVFIMGTAMAQRDPRGDSALQVIRRGAWLVGLGLFMAGFPYFNPARWRIPGVLFRLGVTFVAAAFLWRAVAARDAGLTTMRRVLVVAASCLLGYWALIALIPPPGGAAGDLTAEGNLGAWLDRAVFGTHLWKARWDPEGLLSTLPTIGTALFGVAAGLWLVVRRASGAAARALVGAGVAAIVGGLLWDTVFPINKSLWTSSYALFTSGAAAVALGVLHHLLDDGRAASWLLRVSEPLVGLGRNALLLFVVSGLVAKSLILWHPGGADGPSAQQWIYERGVVPLAPPHIASLLYALANLAALAVLLLWLHRRRWYWSV